MKEIDLYARSDAGSEQRSRWPAGHGYVVVMVRGEAAELDRARKVIESDDFHGIADARSYEGGGLLEHFGGRFDWLARLPVAAVQMYEAKEYGRFLCKGDYRFVGLYEAEEIKEPPPPPEPWGHKLSVTLYVEGAPTEDQVQDVLSWTKNLDWHQGQGEHKPADDRCPKCGNERLTKRMIQMVEGEINWEAAQEAVKMRGIELRGAGADEAPLAYKRLDEVLAAHDGTIRIVNRLRPVGVAMAGADTVDPWKD